MNNKEQRISEPHELCQIWEFSLGCLKQTPTFIARPWGYSHSMKIAILTVEPIFKIHERFSRYTFLKCNCIVDSFLDNVPRPGNLWVTLGHNTWLGFQIWYITEGLENEMETGQCISIIPNSMKPSYACYQQCKAYLENMEKSTKLPWDLILFILKYF